MVATDLREEGLQVDLVPPNKVKRLDKHEAVVVGGALYASRWHRTAKRFVKRHAGELRERPVFFFSSGPLDDSATQEDIPPVEGVRALMEQVGARGHVTFGGRLSPDAKGFPASAMAKNRAGDWRDPVQVRAWARSIAAIIRTEVPHTI
jgi:menaquinone-dependent protoporphyrinogen oxidase